MGLSAALDFVIGSDKTFALYCSRRHPTCIENLARE